MTKKKKSLLEEEIDKTLEERVKVEKSKSKNGTTPGKTPIKEIEEIIANRTSPGVGEIIIGGVPVDVFDIEGMAIKVSPTDMKTVMRYDNARIIEYMRNTKRPKKLEGGRSNSLIWILAIVGIVAAIFVFFGQDIVNFFTNIFGM